MSFELLFQMRQPLNSKFQTANATTKSFISHVEQQHEYQLATGAKVTYVTCAGKMAASLCFNMSTAIDLAWSRSLSIPVQLS